MPDSTRSKIKGLFTDIDDTLTNHGKLLPVAYQALWRTHDAGLLLIPITGRPAGWCDHFARMWPVDGVVGENGAFYFRMVNGKMRKRYIVDDKTRKYNLLKLDQIRQEIKVAVPGAGIASDQGYREFDLAVDFCEDVPRLPMDAVDRIVSIFQKHGATARISSIHVNGWFGTYSKLTMCKLIMQEEFGLNLDVAESEYVFSGDSPNDEPMFQYFSNSVGVENIIHFTTQLVHHPTYCVEGEGGYGFARLVDFLIKGREPKLPQPLPGFEA